MKWYRFFKSTDSGTTVTVNSSVTTFEIEGNLDVTGTTTSTGASTLGDATISSATLSSAPTIVGTATSGVGRKIFHASAGTSGPTVDFIIGAGFTAAGATPGNIGDIYINTTTGKMYIASGTSATSDWKLVTSA